MPPVALGILLSVCDGSDCWDPDCIFIPERVRHCGESKTQRKWFLDEKRDGLLDENRINNQQNENNRRFIHKTNRSVDLICFKQ